jgi:hypothetical protein
MTTPIPAEPVPTAALPDNLLTADAKNRAWRTLLWALFAAMLVDVLPLVYAALDEDGGPVDWGRIGRAALRIAIEASVAFVVRRFGDASALPTAAPAADAILARSFTRSAGAFGGSGGSGPRPGPGWPTGTPPTD